MMIQVVVQARDVAVGDMIQETVMTTAQERGVHTTEAVRTILWHTVSHRTNEQRGDDERTAGMWFDRRTSEEYDWIPIDDTFGEEMYWPDLMLEPSTLIVVWRSM